MTKTNNKKEMQMKHMKITAYRELKREQATARQTAHNLLTNEQKIAKAVSRRGQSARELEKLRGNKHSQ